MTIPTGSKIIPNRYPNKCHLCKAQVGVGDGAAILDVNITGKWATFHTACFPAPYEVADLAAGFVPAAQYHGPRKPVTPGHERCAQCSHWRVDHDPLGCKGHFVGAPGTQCPCLGFTLPGQPLNITAALAAVPPTTSVLPVATTSTATLPHIPALRPTLVVFYGPIRSASDGEEHFIYPTEVLNLHGVHGDMEKMLRVEMIPPERKTKWTPPTMGTYFVIGPHYYASEYDEAVKALAAWLVQEGITA